MPAFPTYGPEEIDALNGVANAVLGVFTARGYTRHEPAILQPAQIFVDRSGEEIRRRTYELTDPTGRELCLRPDLTIPTCKWQVESGNAYPARLCYHGLAFRHETGDGQFYQAGAELLGLGDRAQGDVVGGAQASAGGDGENRGSAVWPLSHWLGRVRRHAHVGAKSDGDPIAGEKRAGEIYRFPFRWCAR